MGVWQVQSTLNRGELDPKVIGRIDLEQYYQGAETAENVVCIPQGGLAKRPGQEYIGTALEVEFPVGSVRLESFSFSVNDNYLLVFTPGYMQVYKDDVLQTDINGTGNSYLVTPWSGSDVGEFDYIQSADTIIITHPDTEPQKIVRQADNIWSLNDALIEYDIPFFDYNDVDSPTTTDEVQTLTFTNFTNGDRIRLSFNGLLTDEIVYDAVDLGVSTAADMKKELGRLPNIQTGSVTASATSALVFRITFLSQSADEWELLKVTPTYLKQATTWTVTPARVASARSTPRAV